MAATQRITAFFAVLLMVLGMSSVASAQTSPSDTTVSATGVDTVLTISTMPSATATFGALTPGTAKSVGAGKIAASSNGSYQIQVKALKPTMQAFSTGWSQNGGYNTAIATLENPMRADFTGQKQDMSLGTTATSIHTAASLTGASDIPITLKQTATVNDPTNLGSAGGVAYQYRNVLTWTVAAA